MTNCKATDLKDLKSVGCTRLRAARQVMQVESNSVRLETLDGIMPFQGLLMPPA
jgi:hypothetical protein